MKISKFISLSSLLGFAALGLSQTLPPPPFAGQTYWYGPGPAAATLSSYTQDTGGWAEFTDAGATWSLLSSGGPAVQNTVANATLANAVFYVPSVATIQPYVYVDGYFGLTTFVSGFSAGTISLGTSRLYVVHNTPVTVATYGATHFTKVGGGAFLLANYDVTYTGYTNASYTGTQNLIGGAAGIASFNLDPVQDSGIAYIDITRNATIAANQASGAYTAIAFASVSAT